jgi:hypothetical protein
VLVVSKKIKMALNCEMGEMQEDAVLICLRFHAISCKSFRDGGWGCKVRAVHHDIDNGTLHISDTRKE